MRQTQKLERENFQAKTVDALLSMADECLNVTNLTFTIGGCDEIDQLFADLDTESVVDNIDVFFAIGVVFGMRLSGASDDEIRKTCAVLKVETLRGSREKAREQLAQQKKELSSRRKT